ncbi:AAA family ATPase [Dethiosulfovibrio salsuginis]|uniref:DNA-binding transcriptional activator of the SARP family n=1 Tax=Dethiosulfovibrio salsuginis TaxID=561720 RepID=A0A1X7IY05_9BACT|nr:AAA family ATPase [Dethiosulfovibrio salsuginis]SMG20030.1 DNA-binding transcriptional activator of the SARP family [Dethiosulfovibrio salsuginis]
MVLKVSLLGPPNFSFGGSTLLFPFRKVQALICYMAVERKASREVLADVFWGDKEGPLALRSLRNALYQARQILPGGTIDGDRQWIFWDSTSVEMDLDRLLDSEISLEEIRSISRPFMEGFHLSGCPRFDEWLESIRRDVERRCRALLNQKASRYIGAGDYLNALLPLEMLIESDPLDEDSYSKLILCLSSLGRYGRVEEIYRLLQERLFRELGMSPSDTVEKLYRRIISKTVNRDKEDNDTPVAIKKVPAFDFCGRNEELKSVGSFLKNKKKGPRCVWISGEAGVGKTCLVEMVISSFCPDRSIFRCGAVPGEDRYPLLPWNDLLGDMIRSFPPDELKLPSSTWSLLGESFPALGIKATSFQPPSPGRIGLILSEIMSQISQRRPLVMVMEDLQWFDGASLEVLESLLVHSFSDILLLLSSRPQIDRSALAFIRSLGRSGRISLLNLDLRCFSRSETEWFCDRFYPERRFSSDEVDRIFGVTDGLPLFLVESLRLLKAGRSVGETPASLSDALDDHLSDLTDNERSLLECLSVYFLKADWGSLSRICGFSQLQLADLVEGLRGRAILAEEKNDGGELFIEFIHGKVKDHVYNSISNSKRRVLHGELAHSLMNELAGGSWNDLACSRLIHHCRNAGMKLEELEYTLKKLKLHINLNYELFPLFNDYLLKESSTSFGSREFTVKELESSHALIREIKRESGTSQKLHELETVFMAIQGGYHLWWGDYDTGKMLVRTALNRATSREDWVMESECLQHLCYYGIQIEDGRLLAAYARRLIGAAGQTGNDPVKAMALRFLGMARIFSQDYGPGERALLSSIGRFEAIEAVDEPYTLQIIGARSYLGDLAHRTGRLEEALSIYESCIKSCEDGGFFRGLCLFHSNAAHVALDLGDLTTMDRHISSAKAYLDGCQWRRGNSIIFSLMALRAFQSGDEAEALDHLKSSDSLCIPLHKRFWLALQLWVKGQIKKGAPQGELGDYLDSSAQDYLERSVDLYREMGIDHKIEFIDRALC